MQGILDYLEGIGEAILSVVDFVISFFQDIVYLVTLTANIALQLPSYFSWLPSSVSSSLLVLFAVVVLYKILGREG